MHSRAPDIRAAKAKALNALSSHSVIRSKKSAVLAKNNTVIVENNRSSVKYVVNTHSDIFTKNKTFENSDLPVVFESRMTLHEKRVSLPDFDDQDPELWFEIADTIFSANEIDSEKKKVAAVLEKLKSKQYQLVRDIITSNDAAIKEAPYTQVKRKLIQVLGESKEKKFDRLLSGTEMPRNEKPSVFLQTLRNLTGGDGNCNDLVKRIWFKKIPSAISLVLSNQVEADLDTLAKSADNMQDMLELRLPSTPNTEVFSASARSTDMALLFETLKNLSTEVAALRTDTANLKYNAEKKQRYRSRSPKRYDSDDSETDRDHKSFYRNRNRSQSRNASHLFRGLCWFHYMFEDDAKKCTSDKCAMKDVKKPEN